jgi:apolipoprotein N-acyltransferase
VKRAAVAFSGATGHNRASRRHAIPLWAAILLAISYGPISDAAFPDQNMWPLAFVGLAILLAALRGRNFWAGTMVGIVAGLAFYLSHISWASLYLGPLPWVALSVLQALFFGFGGGLIALVYKWIPTVWPSASARTLILPLTVGGLWILREQVAGSWPYGGFAWGRVALSQSTGSFADLVSWIGITGLSFTMVTVVAFTLQLLLEPISRKLAIGSATAIIILLLLVPGYSSLPYASMRIVAVQGNGPAGYFSDREPGDLLQAQVQATPRSPGAKADLIVWPEDAVDSDPLRSPSTAATLDEVANATGAPIIFGAITERKNRYYNSTLLWEAGKGVTDVYDKKHPVPFGEYVPDRAFWRPLAPDLIDLVQRDYEIGTRDGVFRVGTFTVGSAICFDIADDGVIRDAVSDGAEVILAQSNNADFGRTDESVQQLAIARMRAIETGRSVVNISTVGVSAIIAPDGSTSAELKPYSAGSMAENVPLVKTATPAMLIGEQFATAAMVLGVTFFSVSGLSAYRIRRRT